MNKHTTKRRERAAMAREGYTTMHDMISEVLEYGYQLYEDALACAAWETLQVCGGDPHLGLGIAKAIVEFKNDY